MADAEARFSALNIKRPLRFQVAIKTCKVELSIYRVTSIFYLPESRLCFVRTPLGIPKKEISDVGEVL